MRFFSRSITIPMTQNRHSLRSLRKAGSGLVEIEQHRGQARSLFPPVNLVGLSLGTCAGSAIDLLLGQNRNTPMPSLDTPRQSDPFSPDANGGIVLARSSKPVLPRAMKVRWRIKGKEDGDVFVGTVKVRGCKTCKGGLK